MATIDDIAPGAGSGPVMTGTRPPEWVSPSSPWSGPAEPAGGPAELPTSPPLADAPGGSPPWSGWSSPTPPPPPPWSAPPGPNGPRRFVLVIVAALVIGGLLGAGLGKVVHLHGARPTLSASPTPSTPVMPTVPGSPVVPSNPSSGGNGSLDTATIAASVNPSIVDVNTVSAYQGGAGAGTGMILTSSGDILTNNHVVDGATSISVTLVSTGRSYTAEVVGTAPTEDIAVIRIKGPSDLHPILIGDSSAVSGSDKVVAIGNAGGAGGAPAVVTGSVLGVNQTITASDSGGQNPETLHGLIRTNAPIQPGDSGGALVNRAGKIIGINTAASARSQFSNGTSEGFAITIAKAVSVARQIESGHETSTIHIGLPGFLGIAIEPSTGQPTNGAVVAGVEGGSPAEHAGLEVGDTITAVDGHTIGSPDSLSALTKSHQKGDEVTVAWTGQDGAEHTAKATLTAGPAD
ncbi:MAG: S1C family serine protease [Actinomycetota bacterium]|nr:S1C family serine protease [Actinomycetota bacterium]